MLKFNEFKYERPDINLITEKLKSLINRFKESKDVESQNEILKEINKIRSNFETMASLVHIRHSINTEDEFYVEEQDFMDEVSPLYQNIVMEFYKALVESKFKDELEKYWGKQVFRLAELEIKTMSPEIIEDMVKENKLSSEYDKLIASAKIDFQGKIRNLSQMQPFMQSKDREIRKEAYEAYIRFFSDNESELDRIYDELVKVRDKMAKKLGYKNFVALGYERLGRTDYDAEMVANYRKQVYEDLVSLTIELKDRQRKRLNLKELKYYDEPLEYLTGNASPKGNPEWILDNGKRMYKELSDETHEFFSYMVETGLLDLVSKKGKMSGGYCTYLPDYKAPFIFSNFNGTSGDVDVLTHEAGHA